MWNAAKSHEQKSSANKGLKKSTGNKLLNQKPSPYMVFTELQLSEMQEISEFEIRKFESVLNLLKAGDQR